MANAYLEGTYSEVYPDITRDGEGMRKLFRQFSFPGGIPSHVAPETPGSIHEGGELGYALSHAYGAAFDNPDLLVCCVVGDGEAETGPLATSWHSNKFLNPVRDGAVLPILHLNGYKIANPTVLARIPHDELQALLDGYGYDADLRDGRGAGADAPGTWPRVMDQVIAEIQRIQRAAREEGATERPRWPMIVLRSPKGWTGPKVVDGLPVEGTWRAHQVPLAEVRTNPEHLRLLETWMQSYRPEELFDEHGQPRAGAGRPAAQGLPPHERQPARQRRPAAARPGPARLPRLRRAGRLARRDLERGDQGPGRLPPRRDQGQPVDNFRLFGPDETASNRLDAVFEVDRPPVRGPSSCRPTSTWRRRAG